MAYSEEELRGDIAKLWKMSQDVKADFMSIQNRYLEVEEERRISESLYYKRIEEIRIDAHALIATKVDRLEKIIKGFSKGLEDHFGGQETSS